MSDPTGTTDEREAAVMTALARPPIAAWLDEMKDAPPRNREILEGLSAYVITLEMSAAARPKRNIDRLVETTGFGIGVGLLATKTFVEILQDAGFLTYPPEHGWPWGLFLSCGLMVLPKFLGKATAGKVWGSIGEGLSRRIGGKTNPDKEETP